MKTLLRLLTLACYFLPFTYFFTTCNNGLELKYAHNQKEADKNGLLKKEPLIDAVAHSPIKSTDMYNVSSKSKATAAIKIVPKDSTTSKTELFLTNLGDDIFDKVIMPTDNSLSGIGTIFYFRSIVGQIAIAISLLASLLVFGFLRNEEVKKRLLLFNIGCQVIFLLNSLYFEIAVLWGPWIILLFLLLQGLVEFVHKKKASPLYSFLH